MNKTLDSMKLSLKSLMNDCRLAWDNENFETWLLSNFPAQCKLVIQQIIWQQTITQAFLSPSKSLTPALTQQQNIIAQMVKLVQGNLNIYQRTLVCTSLVIVVHLRDNINDMIQNQVEHLDNFDWIK